MQNYRGQALLDPEGIRPTGIHHNAVRFVLENRLQCLSAEEIAEAILAEMKECRNGLVEREIHNLAGSFAARRRRK